MTTHNRWILTPATTPPNDGSGNYPKYADTDGITGFSGTTVSPDVVDGHYPTLIQTYPDVGTWYVVRMYGDDTAGSEALDEIHNYQDTRSLSDPAEDLAPILSDQFPGLNRSAEQWASSFNVE